jgi:hypothetical protein
MDGECGRTIMKQHFVIGLKATKPTNEQVRFETDDEFKTKMNVGGKKKKRSSPPFGQVAVFFA